jgi:endo-1,4-beta-xylanase
MLAVLAALAAGCGGASGDDELSPGPIPIDSNPIAPSAYVKPLGTAAEPEHAFEDDAYRKQLIATYTSVTPENAMKWELVEPDRGKFDFGKADRAMQFARRTHKRVRGHTLVWEYQLPAWLEDQDWSPGDLREVMREHITGVMSRYRGEIDEWDVVNEPLTSEGGLKRSLWLQTLGPGYIAYAFEVAHRVDPGAKLFVNELNAELPGPKSHSLLALARHLKRSGVPIDGVGFEFHVTGEHAPSRARIRELAHATANMGLSFAITEMDVRDTNERQQARVYGDAAQVCANEPNCTGLTVWGVTDRFSWLGEDADPLPFDDDGNPKPALRALVEPLRR